MCVCVSVCEALRSASVRNKNIEVDKLELGVDIRHEGEFGFPISC